ncbi:hypothetical protein [uncultured Clostridium sp.]|uniref:hypothetical protein n=1 Tax=uncultured Clostridium sp. TaxID=59620 RepID=UPI0025F40E7E|nr:hypothetical protein [uncultured Clostridium sp.]
MKNRIIFFDDFDNVKVNKLIEIENGGYETYYKKYEDDIFEIICNINFNQIEISRLFSNNISRYIFVFKEINDSNISMIQNLYSNNVTLTTGKVNLNKDDINFNCEFLNDIIYFPQLLDEEDIIDIELFIFAIKNRFIWENHKPIYLIAGKEEEKRASGRIPIFILRRFEQMQKLNEFYLEIYNEIEMNIAEISYVEDCLREYIEDGSYFEINQIKNSYDEENTYFLLSAQ